MFGSKSQLNKLLAWKTVSGSFGIKFKPMVKLSSICMLIRLRLENDTFSVVMFVLPFCGRTTTPVSSNTTKMEPENHPVGKKNHHRNLHYWIPYWFSGVYDICYVCVYIYTHISNKEERSHADFCGISIGWWSGVDSHFGGWYLLSFQISKNLPYRCFLWPLDTWGSWFLLEVGERKGVV